MNILKSIIYILFFLTFVVPVSWAQNKDEGTKESADPFDPSTVVPPTIDLGKEEPAVALKQKKRKKKVFYGLKTRKGFTKSGFGDKVVVEVFYTLKEYKDPDPFVRDIYWFDSKSGKIKKSAKVDKAHARILHGPYKKMVNNQVLEEGIFYIGTKHGRWIEKNKNDILTNKEKYYKGWPRESQLEYYDEEKKKLKQIIPVQNGEEEGYYFAFHDNGALAVTGEFEEGERVGIWREYYKDKRRKKREIQFRQDPFDDKFQSYIAREWDDKGNVVYERKK